MTWAAPTTTTATSGSDELLGKFTMGEELFTNGPGPKADEDEEMGGEGDDYDYDSDLGS